MARGLSPRMRGNLRPTKRTAYNTGSIPAHAGEPLPSGLAPTSGWVYPRACGGTPGICSTTQMRSGLSPRMRGNLGNARQMEAGDGSIPRMRGNLGAFCPGLHQNGSIPAHAGEPTVCSQWGGWDRVYPRACGGTKESASVAAYIAGLSPRMRGNRQLYRDRHELLGSIPAHAGEPNLLVHYSPPSGVYPRACGGTGSGLSPGLPASGLSPRMRGNREWGAEELEHIGSIPAHAGEPTSSGLSDSRRRVYPRACGGT